MDLQAVKSNMISHIGYDPETRELLIRFRNGNQEYKYPNVPAEKHALLLKADSIGKCFQQEIRPHYSGERIPGERAS